MESRSNNSSKFAPVLKIGEIVFLILSSSAIILGIIDFDIFERVILGPILLFCIGLTLQVCIIDTKFPISRKLDIMVESWMKVDHNDSAKISGRFVFMLRVVIMSIVIYGLMDLTKNVLKIFLVSIL